MFSSISNEWETPTPLFTKLNEQFQFTLDPCCTIENKKCLKFYTIETNGLSQSWKSEIVFCNPPYGREIGKWVEKCYNECKHNDVTTVMLIPSRTDTKWFHNYIYNKHEVLFLKGRLKFINRMLPSWNEYNDFKISPAPFPSMLILFSNDKNLKFQL